MQACVDMVQDHCKRLRTTALLDSSMAGSWPDKPSVSYTPVDLLVCPQAKNRVNTMWGTTVVLALQLGRACVLQYRTCPRRFRLNSPTMPASVSGPTASEARNRLRMHNMAGNEHPTGGEPGVHALQARQNPAA